MAPVSSRTSFNSSRLIRILSDLDVVDVADSKQTFAERLGLWMSWTDAIALSSALNIEHAQNPADKQPPSRSPASALVDELNRVRSDLAGSIAKDFGPRADKAGIAMPSPVAHATGEAAVDHSPYRRLHLAHQRAMENRIGALRVSVRAAVSSLSQGLGRLAALDGVLDKALAARERHLLGTVPVLLERHFERLRKAQQRAPCAAQEAKDPEAPMPQAVWLERFCADMRAALLAELEIRLQPIEGLIEALSNEVSRQR